MSSMASVVARAAPLLLFAAFVTIINALLPRRHAARARRSQQPASLGLAALVQRAEAQQHESEQPEQPQQQPPTQVSAPAACAVPATTAGAETRPWEQAEEAQRVETSVEEHAQRCVVQVRAVVCVRVLVPGVD